MSQEPSSPDFAQSLNAAQTGWGKTMGLKLVRATADEVVAEVEIGPQHHQPYGIVHGGVHSGIIESLASLGAAIVAMPRGQIVVGLENHTSFIRAARAGRLQAIAVPLTRGRTTQVWEGSVRDEGGRLLATGRVRLMCLEAGTDLGGDNVDVLAAGR
jgi:1,4-dihydroxy-2-naphthoyl-CoA hydrolase